MTLPNHDELRIQTMTMRLLMLSVVALLAAGCVKLDRQYKGTVPENFNADVWAPSSTDPKAVIIALHSVGDYRVAYQDMGNWMANKGIAVYAYDQPGFGENADSGKWQGTDVMTEALTKVVEQIRQLHPNTPFYLLGESMGAAVAINSIAKYPDMPLTGVILAGPAVREGVAMRYGYNALLNVTAAMAPDKKYPVEGREGALSEAAQKRYDYDTAITRELTADQYYGLTQLTDQASDAAGSIKQPNLILYGGKDTVVKPVSVCWLRQKVQGPSTMLYYPEGPHLVLQSAAQEEVFSNIYQWVMAKSEEDEAALDAPRKAAAALCDTAAAKVKAQVESAAP